MEKTKCGIAIGHPYGFEKMNRLGIKIIYR